MIRFLSLSILLAISLSAQTDTLISVPVNAAQQVDSAATMTQAKTISTEIKTGSVAWPAWVMTFILLSACTGLFFYCRPRKVIQVPIMSRIPEKIPPALIGYLLKKPVPYRALLSTLLDLASRRFLVIRVDRSELILELDRSFWRKNAVHLEEFEDRVIRFVFGGRDQVSTKDFHDEVLAGFAKRWNRKVRLAGDRKPWFDRKRMDLHLRFQIGAAIGLAVSFFLAFWSGWWVLLPAAVSAAVFWIAEQMTCRSETGEIKFRQWTAFRGYFQERRFRNAEPQSLVDKIESYVLYLPVLDVDSEAFLELFRKVPGFSIRAALPWLIFPETSGQSSEALTNLLLQWIGRLSKMESRNWKRKTLKTT